MHSFRHFPLPHVLAFTLVGAAGTGCAVQSSEPAGATNQAASREPVRDVQPAVTNTNQCITDLGGILACQSLDAVGLPNDLEGCCTGLLQLDVDRCSCNPALNTLLGTQGQEIYDLKPLCAVIQPLSWLENADAVSQSCDSLQTHDYGCPSTDMEIDAARLQSILNFQTTFTAASAETCLDTPDFITQLGTSLTSDVVLSGPYGIGVYSGTRSAGEYISILFPGLNDGYWSETSSAAPNAADAGGGAPNSEGELLAVSANGSSWTFGDTTSGSFVNGALPYTNAYIEQELGFQGCNTLASTYTVHPTPGFDYLIESFVQASQSSERWGVEDICRYHTQYCAGNPALKQYDSEQDCLDYISSLPLYTEACGPNRPLSGGSLSCKFKHHFMVPADPEVHCAHIGKIGVEDINGDLVCDDDADCSEDAGQNAWPPVTNFGADTPANVLSAYAASNVGYQSAPLSCATELPQDLPLPDAGGAPQDEAGAP